MSLHDPNDDFRMFGIPELSKLLGISRSSIYEAIKEGALVASKLGKRTLFKREHVRAFLESLPTSRTVSAPDPD